MHTILTAIDEAIAIIDRFIAADSSAPAFAAVIKMLLGKIRIAAEALAPDMQELEEFRAKAEATRIRNAACQARRRAASPTCHGDEKCHGDTVSSRARSSSSSSVESKVDDDEDARARPIENKSAEQAATEIEQIVRAGGRWPDIPSTYWNHSTVVAQLDHRIRQGFSPQVMIDAVRIATARATNVIHSFAFFNKPGGAIEQAHAQATDEPQLFLPRSIEGGKGARHHGGHHARRPSDEEKFRADLAAKRLAEATNGNASDGVEPEAGIAVEAAENG
jgi:hypothetical protein